MKGKKSFIPKRFIIFLLSILTIVSIIILSNVMFNQMQNEQEIIRSYEEKEQKCELLKVIAKESIQEGIGIDTRKISNDEVQYRIYNDKERIIFYYYLKESYSNTKPMYNATITLNNEYKILQEEYSIEEVESFEEYAKMYNRLDRIIVIGFSSICMMGFYIIIFICYYVLKDCINKRGMKE